MEKKDKIYYEKLYLAHLKNIKKAQMSKDESKIAEAKAYATNFFRNGLQKDLKNDSNPNIKTYFEQTNDKNYNKFAKKNVQYWNGVLSGDLSVDSEIERMSKRKKVKKQLAVVGGTVATIGLLTACIVGLTKCSKNKNSKPSQTTNGVTSGSIDDTTKPTEKRPTFTDYDMDSAVSSLSDDYKDYTINNDTYPYFEDGEVVYGLYDDPYDGSNDIIESTFDPSFPSMTEVDIEDIKVTQTTPTTTTTETSETQTQPTINSQGETVPTTSMTETEPRYTEEDGGRDVVENIYDDVQPSYIEEDENETYETYTTFDNTTSTTSTSSTTSSMEVEEDENETYETYMTFDTKEANQQKGNAKTYRR